VAFVAKQTPRYSRHVSFVSHLLPVFRAEKNLKADVWHSLFAQGLAGRPLEAKCPIYQNLLRRCATIKFSWIIDGFEIAGIAAVMCPPELRRPVAGSRRDAIVACSTKNTIGWGGWSGDEASPAPSATRASQLPAMRPASAQLRRRTAGGR
jgi:hypothetical protein